MTALALLRRFWWAPVIVGLLFAVLAQRTALARKNAAIERLTGAAELATARVEQATLTFKANALANAHRIETAQAKASQETAGEYASDLARAQALAAAYARRLRDAAARGGAGGGADLPGAANAPGGAAGTGGLPVMDDGDLQTCTENTVKALGWRAWWAKVSAIPR